MESGDSSGIGGGASCTAGESVSSVATTYFFGDEEQAREYVFHRFQITTDLDYTRPGPADYGAGGFGKVYTATDTVTQEALAVKVIDTEQLIRRQPGTNRERILETIMGMIRNECQILETLNPPNETLADSNVIRIKAHGPGTGNKSHLYFIFMELASGGELFDRVAQSGGPLPEDEVRGYALQLLAGVDHCHSRRVAHRDIKLDNVVLTSEGVVKIIDFGHGHVYSAAADGTADRSVLLTDGVGTRMYMAPEVRAGSYDGFAADVWSIGVTLFTMLLGHDTWERAENSCKRYRGMWEAQSQGNSGVRALSNHYGVTHLSDPVIDLLDRMLVINPANRFTMEQVRTHPWVTGKEFNPQPLPPPPPPPPTPEIRYRNLDDPVHRGAPEPPKLTRQNAYFKPFLLDVE